jgi:DNA-binding NtrC family response regulator
LRASPRSEIVRALPVRPMTRVLVVDDDRAFCETLEAGLTKRGLDVGWATDAEIAFERLLAENVDVVITDLNMPGFDGNALCERIVANRPEVPVVVMTAFGCFDSAVAAMRSGAYRSSSTSWPLRFSEPRRPARSEARSSGSRGALARVSRSSSARVSRCERSTTSSAASQTRRPPS